MNGYGYVRKNYENLVLEIAEYDKRLNRKITVVAVTKSGSDGEVVALVKAGATDIAENRPSELKRRAELLREAGFAPRLHEIGNLQRNKVKLVINEASFIHSVGKFELAKEISRQATALGITSRVLIEVNSAKEELKGGVFPEDAEELFLKVRELAGIEVMGIMTMGPALDNAELMRPYFRLTKEIFDRINEKYGFVGEGILSMGMSDSYEYAIEAGATMVRVGSKIFGERKY